MNPANGLVDELRRKLTEPISCLMISSYPDDKEITDRMAWETRESFEWAKLKFEHFEVLDRRTQRYAKRMVEKANLIILCGGHVPTENRFFQDLNLKALLQGYKGVLLTISAGSMNCAEPAYGPPEYDGEAIDPDYQSYFPGLDLTDVHIIPHYQQLRTSRIGGKRLIYDIVASDSYRHPVYGLPDGSYFKITPKGTVLCGEAYRISKGKIRRVCRNGERKRLTPGHKLYAI